MLKEAEAIIRACFPRFSVRDIVPPGKLSVHARFKDHHLSICAKGERGGIYSLVQRVVCARKLNGPQPIPFVIVLNFCCA